MSLSNFCLSSLFSLSLPLITSITIVKTQNPNTVYQKRKKKNPTQKLIPNPKQTHNHANLAATTTTRQPLTQSSSRHRRHPLLLSSPVVVSIHPKPICSHKLFLIIIIFTETHYQTNPANTETHHQTHRKKSQPPDLNPTTQTPHKCHPNPTQTLETHEQTHDLHTSTTKTDLASTLLPPWH